jgi:hypothetical protein
LETRPNIYIYSLGKGEVKNIVGIERDFSFKNVFKLPLKCKLLNFVAMVSEPNHF